MIVFFIILVVQIGFKRTLVDQQGKTAKDYVRQGIDQLGQAAEKVKQAVSNATATVSEAVSGDRITSKFCFKILYNNPI